ncbi:MAG: hypothetical protein GC201_00935 [Alphaproteobacteria bacterium]|nr:hypothetical protein [Alphaproteobacteria bacterium]
MTGLLASIALPPAVKAVTSALPWKAIAIGAAVLAAAGGLWWLHSAAWHAGYDKANAEWTARQQATVAAAQADANKIAASFSGIDMDVVTAIHTIEQTRTVYRDRIEYEAVDVYRDKPECALPDGLREQINSYAGELARASGVGVGEVPVDNARGADHPQPGRGQ